MIETIRTIIAAGQHDHYGLRVMHTGQAAAVGAVLPASVRWDDGEPTDDALDGTSTISVRISGIDQAVAMLAPYRPLGGAVVLVGGNQAVWGEDAGEIIIRDAVCLAVLDA